MADLADLAALKLQLEAEAGQDTQDAEVTSEGLLSDAPDGTVTPERGGDSQPSEEVSEVVLAAVLRHTPIAGSELDPQASFAQLGIGKLARWAIASTIETELRISIADAEVESWDSIANILMSIKRKIS